MPSVERFSSVLMGEETLLIQCADILIRRGHEIQAIVTANRAIQHWAREHGLPHLDPTPDLAARLGTQSFDYFFSITNLSIIPAAVLALPRRGAINFHDGPLPNYAGLYATSWALLNREQTHGVTWHVMGDQVDTGDILKQALFPIDDDFTALSLNTKCYEVAVQSFADLVDELGAGQTVGRRQDLAGRVYFGRYQRPVAAATLDWRRPAHDLAALARALDFGPYANALGLPKLLAGGQALLAPELTVLDTPSTVAPGTLTRIGDDGLQVATATQEVVLRHLLDLDGQPLTPLEAAARLGLRLGDRLDPLDPTTTERLTALNDALCRHETFWRGRLTTLEPVELPYGHRGQVQTAPPQVATLAAPLPTTALATWTAAQAGRATTADLVLAAVAAYVARLSGTYRFDLGFRDAAARRTLAGEERLFAAQVPLRVALDPAASGAAATAALLAELALVRRRPSYPRDMVARYPDLRPLRDAGGRPGLSIAVEQGDQPDLTTLTPGRELTVVVADDGALCHWVYDPAVFDQAAIEAMQGQFATFITALATGDERALATMPLLDPADLRQLTVAWNATQRAFPADVCIHQLFEAQVERTPDAVALVFEHDHLTYGDLNARANQLARHLRDRGAGPGALVGLCVERSLEMVVGLLGILKAGAAYVPLDPNFPRERVGFMLADAQVAVLVTQARLREDLPAVAAPVVAIDADWDRIARLPAGNLASAATARDLAYVIYTSGSTGRPKGVMVTHGNAVNFFTGMDDRLDHQTPGVWLAVTSISFDISVLELFWTLTRGFKVIVQADDDRTAAVMTPGGAVSSAPIDFSLFYFASTQGGDPNDKYRLLLEGARFADDNGFAAVWTPERHFHEFGGLYPNPSVISAALATMTKHVHLRAGSVVVPLQNTLRVAEEWSVVDNLSHGRVGVSFTPGWIADDFVLAPEHFATRKEVMAQQMEAIRTLWRGGTIPLPNGVGKTIDVRVFPRPIQPDLPAWITAAGAPDTFRLAGEMGANLLTHLLGQTIDDLAAKVRLYRQARQEHGHDPDAGIVTLMMHTFIGDDMETVRAKVQKPLIDYLKTSGGLVRTLARGMGQDLSTELTEAEMEEFLYQRFDRYFETSGLMGTPDRCLETVERLKGIGVNEVACLIDFGVEAESVMASLPLLARLRERANRRASGAERDFSLPAQIRRHGVTHFQCTPSMAGMLAMTPETLATLRPLRKLMIGGEAFPPALAAQLRQAVDGDVINMYGPTETTVWSTTHPVDGSGRPVPIGRPIANTTIYLLDQHRQVVPVGVPGELVIGGAGVTAGYLNRSELTAERFIGDPFDGGWSGRLYRTGDLARYAPDGTLEFLGRLDHQVKIRGFRIELGEIEVLLNGHEAVQEAIVVAREDAPGDKRLVAYLIANPDRLLESGTLRDYLKEQLPEHMIPSAFVVLPTFPLTPNGKIDRKALPAPDQARPDSRAIYVAPQTEVERTLAELWQRALHVSSVGTRDNFFDLGGHSLMAMNLIAGIRETFQVEVPLRAVFKTPTIAGLATVVEHALIEQADDDQLTAALANLETLSDEEVRALLAR